MRTICSRVFLKPRRPHEIAHKNVAVQRDWGQFSALNSSSLIDYYEPAQALLTGH